jgi:hypothetical protein
VARNVDYTIAYEAGGQTVDLCKILFGGDGSYYVTAPYHPHERAIAAKITVNYPEDLLRRGDEGEGEDSEVEGKSAPGEGGPPAEEEARNDFEVTLEKAHEVATVDDDDKRLKIAHHPDGFLQFSGQGIRSGLDENGEPKGIGTFSWPVRLPTLGPSFGLQFSDPFACGRPSAGRPRTVVLPEAEIEHMRWPGFQGLRIGGYYFPLPWREFVHVDAEGRWWISIVHPLSQAIKRLRVIFASVESDYAGFIGLEARPFKLPEIDGQPTFYLSTSTGNLRRNEAGDLLGDQLICMYPALDFEEAKPPSLNYPLPAPPYEAPPGTTEIIPEEEADNKGGSR